jgi:hypothetical protein
MFESIILPAVVSLVTASLYLWVKSYLARREQRTNELQKRSEDSFLKLLDYHSKLFLGINVDPKMLTEEMRDDQIHTRREIAIWGSDKVVCHCANALIVVAGTQYPPPTPYEIELAKAILAFRKKELKFHNKRVTPGHIVALLRGGYNIPFH